MTKEKKTLTEKTYHANVLPDGVVTHIESLEGTNLMPQNTDFEQLKSLDGPKKDKGSRLFVEDKTSSKNSEL